MKNNLSETMSKQWNRVSSITTEPIFSEVISEELRNRVQVEEDFVWVEGPETGHKGANTCEGEIFKGNPADRLCNYIVQPWVDYNSSEEEFHNHDEYSDANNCFPEIVEHEYINQCIRKKVKPFNPDNVKYPNLHRSKISERGVFSVEKLEVRRKQIENDKSHSKAINELLPKMKFDASTTEILENSIKNRYIGKYHEMIGSGKNSIVFYAFCHSRNCMTMPFENAVKIYKTSKDEKKNEIIYKKVQREYEHLGILMRCWEMAFRSPCAVRAWKNVIIMRFVGVNHTKVVPPSIETVPFERDQSLYNDIIDYIDKCYNKVNLVHGNLSVKNIRYMHDKPHFLGWSQSVKRSHPMAFMKLMKDCHFITKFYEKRGVAVKSTIDLFKQISGHETIDNNILEIFREKDLYKKYKINPNRINTSSVKLTTNKRFK